LKDKFIVAIEALKAHLLYHAWNGEQLKG